MEGNLHGLSHDVKTEAADQNNGLFSDGSALLLSSQESAPCGERARRGGGGGGRGEQTTEADKELQAATTTTPVLLYSVSADRFFTTPGDGKTYLKIAPASAMPPASPEKTPPPSGSDFSSKAVLCLIEAVGRRWDLYETRERSQLFQSVQEEMAAKGHMLPVGKIRRKWNNLIVTYKRVKDRSREMGHAKTSWEFFDLMDAMLSDTIGSQIINNKRNRGVTNVVPVLPKMAVKPALPASIGRPPADCAAPGSADSVAHTIGAARASVSTATISPANAAELKINGDAVTTSVHPTAVVPTPSFVSSHCFTETSSAPVGSADANTLSYTSHQTSSSSQGVLSFCLSAAPPSHTQSAFSLSSSLPPTPSCLTVTTSLPAAERTGPEERKGNKKQSSVTLFQEVLRRHEEQDYLDRAARRRTEAREKRRERREVRMSESLGRIATALELLSSKQDTIIALLQRLADRK